MKDEALKLALDALEAALSDDQPYIDKSKNAITAIKQALSAPVQEPVAMRMPKVGDKVVCIEDESLGTVVYLTAGGSPEIKFDDGSHGTYMLREFAELFGYTTPPAAQRQWVELTDEEVYPLANEHLHYQTEGYEVSGIYKFAQTLEAKLKEKNT
jgi:hypothetical protein